VTDHDRSSIQLNTDNVAYMKRAKEDNIPTLYFVNELYVTVRDTPEELLIKQPLRFLYKVVRQGLQ
jgi:hypothetical protein